MPVWKPVPDMSLLYLKGWDSLSQNSHFVTWLTLSYHVFEHRLIGIRGAAVPPVASELKLTLDDAEPRSQTHQFHRRWIQFAVLELFSIETRKIATAKRRRAKVVGLSGRRTVRLTERSDSEIPSAINDRHVPTDTRDFDVLYGRCWIYIGLVEIDFGISVLGSTTYNRVSVSAVHC